jgi:hypothetical protein
MLLVASFGDVTTVHSIAQDVTIEWVVKSERVADYASSV